MKKAHPEHSRDEGPRFIDSSRRQFIQRSALIGGAATAASVSTQTQAAAQAQAAAPQPGEHAGYRLTDKVKEYYRKARF